MFNLEKEIPYYKIVKITDASGESITDSVPFILEDGLSIKVSSKYGELWEASPNNFMSLLSSSFGLPSGQFALQGVQIWQSTDPIDMSISVSIEMDTDSYKEVMLPIISLMSICLPTKGSNGSESQMGKTVLSNLKLKTLIPPGPNIQAIWSAVSNGQTNDIVSKALAHFNKASKGVYNMKIGYVNLNGVIIKNVEPSFASEMSYSETEGGYYPVRASVALEISTMEIATTDMIKNIFKKNRG